MLNILIRKYLKNNSTDKKNCTLSLEAKKRIKNRKNLVTSFIEPLDLAGVPINGSTRKIRGKM